MSRSFRHQPFQAICGGKSAHHDKTLAARAMRRTQDRYTKQHIDDEDFLIPARYECAFNNTYSWGRDGKQRYQALDIDDWNQHLKALDGIGHYPRYYMEWPPEWYVKMMRK